MKNKAVDITISQLLSPMQLQRLAGEPSYSRGVEYFDEGRVADVHLKGNCIHANVRGSRKYRVELSTEGGEISYSCSCPFFQDTTAFCKHCVAAGLAFLHANEADGGTSMRKIQTQQATNMKYVEAYLKSQEKASLVSMLLDQTKDDDRLFSRLLMKADMGKKVNTTRLKKVVDRAVDRGDFVDYESMPQYSDDLYETINNLNDLLEEKHAVELMELSEYFLTRLEIQMDMVDDSDGYMSDILANIEELHHEACVLAKPDPEHLARKLFAWELRSGWEVFYGASERYADVLGKKGLKVYEALAKKEWAKLSSLKAGDDRHSFDGNRFRITSIMEQLASQTGDVEKLVAVKKKDLSSAYSYFEIAEIFKKDGKADKALEWAEKGVQAFPKQTDSRLREFLANEYHERKRHDDAMQIIWAEFVDDPRFEEYKLLKKHAERAGNAEAWKHWREKALQLIRKGIADSNRAAKGRPAPWYANDRSELVKIFLWEKDFDAAWAEAEDGGCHESLWRELAAKREADHPEDALAVYQSLVEPQITRMNNEAYRDAAALVKKIALLFKRLGKEEAWNHYRNTLCETHKRKRNFMALLEKIR
ncbi:MAG: DUF6880 family protein [Bacteroidota bacterium]